MNSTGNKHRQIVTNGEYVRAQGKRAGLRGWGLLMGASGMLCALVEIWILGELNVRYFSAIIVAVLTFIVVGYATCFCFRQAWANMEQAKQIDPGVPVSRVISAQLPEVGSLVRASQEPVEVQRAVLLRPATDEHNTPAEHLVRPFGNQE